MKREDLTAKELHKWGRFNSRSYMPKAEVERIFDETLEMAKKEEEWVDFSLEEITDTDEFVDWFNDNLYNAFWDLDVEDEIETETDDSELFDTEENEELNKNFYGGDYL